MAECDLVLIVRTPAARDAVLNAVTDEGVKSVQSEMQVEGSKMCFFRNHDGRKVGIIVSAASSDLARKRKMEGIATRVTCPCIGLIDPGYSAGDINPRTSLVPPSCALVFIEDVEMLMEVLGYRMVDGMQREVLKPLFLRQPQQPEAHAGAREDQTAPIRMLDIDATAFRALRAQAAEQGPHEEAEALRRSRIEATEALRRSRIGAHQRRVSVMVNDVEVRPRFERAVPSAAAQQAARNELPPRAPNRRAPPLRNDPHYDNMDFMGNPMDLGEGEEPAYQDQPPDYYPHYEEGPSNVFPLMQSPQSANHSNRPAGTPPPAWYVDMMFAARPDERSDRSVRAPPLPNDPRERAQEMLQQQMRQIDIDAADNAVAVPSSGVQLPVLPMTNQERRRRSRLRVDERSQQQALTGLVANKQTKKALEKKRDEATDIDAMCISAEDNACTICMEKHITTMVLPCRHTSFCHACISYWVDAHNTCPTCKAEVATIVQMITKFDAIEEHKRRRLEADSKDDNKAAKARRREVAAALRKEADELEAAEPPPKEEDK
jgi:hypothetical protein